jgi:hypothetical protein
MRSCKSSNSTINRPKRGRSIDAHYSDLCYSTLQRAIAAPPTVRIVAIIPKSTFAVAVSVKFIPLEIAIPAEVEPLPQPDNEDAHS